jgi:hypothetical protein
MDAFEKWWHGIPEEDRGEYSDMRLAFEEGLRRAAGIARIAENTSPVKAKQDMAARIKAAILKEADK